MSQSQVYLFLYEHFDVWRWITGTKKVCNEIVFILFSILGQRRRYHAGLNLYGKEYCYTKDGILSLPHVLLT